MRPLHDRVVIRRITPLEKSAASILITDTAKEKPKEDRMIAGVLITTEAMLAARPEKRRQSLPGGGSLSDMDD